MAEELILIVDDEKSIRETIALFLEDEGFSVDTAGDGLTAKEKMSARNYALIISDIKMPRFDGLQLLSLVQREAPQTLFLLITAYASVESAIKALRSGAFDYLIKPIDLEDLLFRVKKGLEHRRLQAENRFLRSQLQVEYSFDNIIGDSAKMQQVFAMISKVARTKSSVLLSGPSGSGKELAARSIHYNSTRNEEHFVAVNCGAIVETLMESEFFGHKKGAFTGAIRDKEGFFLRADKGTLFLDEIGEIPQHLQVKLLRVLEEGVITPVGSTESIAVDVRIIAATNRDLRDDIATGRFREDLFYRLNVVEIDLPGLVQRKSDIPLLVKHFIDKYNAEMGTNVRNADNEAMQVLLQYHWPGGIRELQNAIERALIFSEGEYISKLALPPTLLDTTITDKKPERLKDATAIFEREHIKKVLAAADGKKEEAAKRLDISVSSLYRKLEEN
jgi:DNA-binding NtrC family response regulator